MIRFSALQNARYMQYLSAFVAALSMASTGTMLAWVSPALPKLLAADSPLEGPITQQESSWVVSSSIGGAVPVSILTAYCLNKMGRKTLLLISALFLFIPSVMTIFAQAAWLICVARFIAGASMVMAISTCAVYTGEISENDIRGKIGLILTITSIVGVSTVLMVGPFVSYTWLNVYCSVTSLLFGILLCFIPESPYYLVTVGKIEEARVNLIVLSRNSADKKFIDNRLEEIQTTIKNQTLNKGTLWELLSNREHRKALIIIIGTNSLQHLCGSSAIQSYLQQIVATSQSNVSPEISSIIFGAIQLPAALITGGLVDKLGRKPLLLFSALGCAVATFGEGVYFYRQDYAQADTSAISWIPTTGIVLFLMMQGLGILPVPLVLVGELFQANVKGIAVSVTMCYGFSLAFVSVQMFEPLSSYLGMYVVFWIFSALTLLGALFILLVVPETKGKSFEDIQKKLNNAKS